MILCGIIPLSFYCVCELSGKLEVDCVWCLTAEVPHCISARNLRTEGCQALEGGQGPEKVMLVFWHN